VSTNDSVQVSDPVLAALDVVADVSARSSTSPRGAAGNAADEVAYVSFPPMTVQTTRDSARIRNPAAEAEVTAVLFRGGLDPVAVPATVGDSLDIWIFDDDTVAVRFVAEVPPLKPPNVVRSVPSRGETSVPLNAKVVVILSEPADPATVSPATFQLLLDGVTIPAEVTAEGRGFIIHIAPAEPLERFTEYEVRISDQIRDLSGNRLDPSVSFRFTTGSPAAGRIAYDRIEFTSTSGGRPGQQWTAIFTVNADGSDIRRVSPEQGYHDSSPEWSPDGTKIAFQRQTSGPASIWVMDGDGRNAVQLTDSPLRDDSGPTWSGDGTAIAYLSWGDDGGRIMLMNADGTNPRYLATPSGWSPDISPDGTKVLFVSYEPGDWDPYCRVEEFYNCAIFVVNTDGSGLTQIEPELGNYPRWSPDGSKIAFVKNIRMGSQGEIDLSTLYVMNADGSDATPVVSDRIVSPDWSPDGSQITYESQERFPSMRGAIVTVYVDGTGWTTVVPVDYPNWNGHPSWAP
jgi:Tol biopolymer transport system component